MASIDRHDEGFIGHGGTAPRTKSQQMRSTIFDNQWPDDTPAQPRRITSGKEVSADAMAAAAAFGHTPSVPTQSGKSPSYHRAMYVRYGGGFAGAGADREGQGERREAG